MKIAFVWWWDGGGKIIRRWRDGLRGAMEIVGQKHDVTWFLDETWPNPEDNWDVILLWGDSYCPFFIKFNEYPNTKKGLFLTTEPHNVYNLSRCDWVFCESDPILRAAKQYGNINAIKAFGTDTDFFVPDPTIVKDIPVFYPATFSPWKRQSEIASLGKHLLCMGTVQPDGIGELKACKAQGVQTKIGYFSAEKLRNYYNRSNLVVIPAVHGSERTVLESMAMGIPPLVYPWNERARSYVAEYANSKHQDTRDFILENYSHHKYAETILNAIE